VLVSVSSKKEEVLIYQGFLPFFVADIHRITRCFDLPFYLKSDRGNGHLLRQTLSV